LATLACDNSSSPSEEILDYEAPELIKDFTGTTTSNTFYYRKLPTKNRDYWGVSTGRGDAVRVVGD